MTDEQPEKVWANLIDEMQSLQLSTIGPEGQPHCSYTPYLYRSPNSVYILISQLAAHTRHLLANNNVAIMIIADEKSTSQIFARTRVHYVCQALRIHPEDPEYASVLDDYERRHGQTVSLLRQLPDFILFQLKPESGQFVMGFGKAYKLTGDNLSVFEHTHTG